MTSFWIALQFLTRLPCPTNITCDDERQLGHSALYYPLIGAIMGLILIASGWVLEQFTAPSALIAIWLLTLWVMLSGALHLDGLGDSADAWMGGGRDRQRCLTIMQDSCAGTAAVVSIALLLLMKFIALEHLLTHTISFWILLLVPVLAHGAVLALLLSTPSVRANGFSAHLSQHLPQKPGIAVILVITLLVILIWPMHGSLLLLGALVVTLLLRRMMLQRLGGITGDTCGALIEINEAVLLGILCLF